MLEISIKWFYLHNVDLASGAWQELDLLRGRRQAFGQQRPQAISSGVLLRRGALFGAVFPLIALLVVALLFRFDQPSSSTRHILDIEGKQVSAVSIGAKLFFL